MSRAPTFFRGGKWRRPIIWVMAAAFSCAAAAAQEVAPWGPGDSVVVVRSGAHLLGDSVESLLRRFNEKMIEAGHPFAAVWAEKSRDSSGESVRLHVLPGPQAVFDSVLIGGASSLPLRTREALVREQEGAVCSPGALRELAGKILQSYRDLGYQYAEVTVTRVSYTDDAGKVGASASLQVSEGERVRIEKVRVAGNDVTRSDLIIRAARIEPGEYYTGAQAQRVRQRLMRLGLFSEVTPEFYTSESERGVLITVREVGTNTFNGIVGYVPSGPNGGGGYFTGDASISLRNLFGTGRAFAAQWRRENESTQDLSVRYREPWVLSLPLNLEGRYGLRQQDSTYVMTEFEVTADTEIWDGFFAGGSFGRRSVIPSDGPSGQVPGSSRTSAGVFLRYDSRDDPWSPSSGFRYETEYRYGSKSMALSAGVPSAAVQETRFDGEGYISVSRRSVLALGAHLRDVEGSAIDESDLYRIGGARMLRGYREGQFLASRAIVGSAEFRLLTGGPTFLFGFVDAASLQRPALSAGSMSAWRAEELGYGFGIQTDTALGILNAGYALGAGDTFTTGKIHVSILNEF